MTSKTDTKIDRNSESSKQDSSISANDAEPDIVKLAAIGVGVLFFLGMVLALVEGEPGLALLIPMIGLITAGMLIKEFGQEFTDALSQMQQQNSLESGLKQICPKCGWQNPSTNNFCHDCGSKLGTNE